MRKIILLLAICLTGFAYSQSTELAITVKNFQILDEKGTQSPFIDYVDGNGVEQRFWFELPKLETDKYAEIMIGDALLIKVESASDYGDFVLIESYEFHEDVADSLVGKKIRIAYEMVDMKAYLYSIEIVD